ncbi:hypothetical protein G6F57_017636 [Rhizopus arrhizus]|nr:hypothetical protein G6F41_013502 [Rhizopus arrhizus]KAG1445198.1 hypothetical protein G6F57_017636 [Rhizopus arrhizus]
MVRALSKNKQESIKSYANKFSPGRVTANPGRKAVLSVTTKSYIRKQIVNAWAEEHKNWTSDDWRRMVFSDETKVNVYGSDGCKYFWSRPDDKLQPHHLDLTVKGGGGSIMVWGCITYDGPGYACWITLNTTVADKTGAQNLKLTLYLRHMSATFVVYTI